MNFSNASVIEQLVWEMSLADYQRSLNRSLIDDLFNGVPPYSDKEVKENNVTVNVNFLEATKLAHDARRQFYNAFLKPGNFFIVTLDSGPVHKRGPWGKIITAELNRCLKRSQSYYEHLRSTFANVVLHGIGPVVWSDQQIAIPKAIGVEDVLFPSQTLVSLENVEFFAVARRYTASELYRLTSGKRRDPGWKMKTVKEVIEWAHRQGTQSIQWQDIWKPERLSELLKSDLGFYTADKVPTIDCWDFYNKEDSDGECGWCRRIVLAAQGDPGIGGYAIGGSGPQMTGKNFLGNRGQFLYDSGKRKFASNLSEIIHFQFGDLSAVAPFRYHSVRSLGFLLYAICKLQNRLRCSFTESVFEQLLQYFRVASPDDAEKALKINLINRGIIDDSVKFIPAAERWQVNQALAEAALGHNRELMGSNAAAYTQDYDFGREQTKKTATEVMAQVNASTALVQAALQQAYALQTYQYHEICRRFCIKNSRDGMVNKFRAAVRKQGVPEEYINSDCWDIEAERIIGSGNKIMELTMLDKLMASRPLYDPESQRDILSMYTLGLTDDAAVTNRLVPMEQNRVTNSVHDAQLATGSLLLGLPVSIKSGINRTEYIEAMLVSLATKTKQIEDTGGMATEEEIVGIQNVLQHLQQNIAILAQDKNEKQRVKVYMDAVGKIENLVRAYAQRLQQEQQKAAQQNGQMMDPTAIVKAQLEQQKGQMKLEQQRQSHAARTAERQTAWELDQQREEQSHQAQLRRDAETAVVEDAATQMRNDAELRKTEQKKE